MDSVANDSSTSFNTDAASSSDRPLLDFVDDLGGNGRSLLYVQARLLLARLNEALAEPGVLEELGNCAATPAAPEAEAQQALELARLMRSCGLHDGWEADHDNNRLGRPGVRLLRKLGGSDAGATGPLLLSLSAAVDFATTSASGHRVWTDCMKLAAKEAAEELGDATDDGHEESADDADGAAYVALKREIQGTQYFFPIHSRRIQQALILLDSSICLQ